LGANSAAGSSNAASVVSNLPAGSRVLLHALDLVHKSTSTCDGEPKRRPIASVVAGLRAALPRSVLRAAVGREEGEEKGEEEEEEVELRAWVVRAARAMPLLRVGGEDDSYAGGEGCWLGLASA
jgi:hypothetical protein